MRIISGTYKGKNIEGFDINGTRPTMDRVKESLFGMIGSHIKGSTVLDLFGGTGSLGLEAISEGACICYFVDQNKIAIETIKRSIKKIGITEEIYVMNMDYERALQKFVKEKRTFDLVFLDPPYDLFIINDILLYINENKLLQKNGLIICEYEKEPVDSKCFTVYKEKRYGSKNIKIYQNKNLS